MKCLNPFEIRAGLELQGWHNMEAPASVLIPLKSGQVWNQQKRGGESRRNVLIPLKSGQVWNCKKQRVTTAGLVLIPLKSGQVWNLDALRNSFTCQPS